MSDALANASSDVSGTASGNTPGTASTASTVLLRFSTERWSLAAALIRWRTDCCQSHVEYQLPDGSTYGARFSLIGKLRRWLGMQRTDSWRYWDGVCQRPPESTHRQVAVVHATFDGIDAAYEWAREILDGDPYDLAGILGIALADGWHEQNDKYCSETIALSAAAAKGARGAGNVLVDADPSAVTPRDLLVSVKVKVLAGTSESASCD